MMVMIIMMILHLMTVAPQKTEELPLQTIPTCAFFLLLLMVLLIIRLMFETFMIRDSKDNANLLWSLVVFSFILFMIKTRMKIGTRMMNKTMTT